MPDLLVSPEELLAFLQDPEAYPHRPRRVHIVQTHISYVAIAPPYVYKIKKPVNFGFVDFSTLEKRRYFCEQEVILNRRLCPHLYLGVVPISRRNAQLVWGSGDEVVEYAVQMRRLAERFFMKRWLARGALTKDHIERLVRKLATFYQSQTPTEAITTWGRIERIRISTDENFEQTERFIGDTIARPAFEAIRRYTNRFYEVQADRFTTRMREGWIRDCHGDLHLQHVYITARRVCIYDCIEFNERFRYIDVASDVAFLAMDLDYHGRPDLAHHFVKQMAAALDDRDMETMVDFYKCYRAYVRGKVESLQAVDPHVPLTVQDTCRRRARRYFQLALQYVVAGSTPAVLVVMGPIGTGKSTVARHLGELLGWPVFSSDPVRKEIAGLPLHERTHPEDQTWLYSPAMSERVYGTLLERAMAEVRAGRGAILDATFGRRIYRTRLRTTLRDAGIPWVFVEITAPREVIRDRLMARDRSSGVVSDARVEDMDRLLAAYEPPEELLPGECAQVDATGSVEETVTMVLIALVDRQFT